MKIGEIYYWNTDKVQGRDDRRKYHVFICVGDWKEGNTFLFINKAGNSWDLEVSNQHPAFTFLPLPQSFVDCGSIVTYSDTELDNYEIEKKGRITLDIAKALHDSVFNSGVMRRDHKRRVCNALQSIIKSSLKR